jgi:hypothetical protein
VVLFQQAMLRGPRCVPPSGITLVPDMAAPCVQAFSPAGTLQLCWLACHILRMAVSPWDVADWAHTGLLPYLQWPELCRPMLQGKCNMLLGCQAQHYKACGDHVCGMSLHGLLAGAHRTCMTWKCWPLCLSRRAKACYLLCVLLLFRVSRSWW